MEITINGTRTTTGAKTLAELIAERGIDTAGVALALGQRVVPRSQWETTPLPEGATVTVIRATQGG